MAQKNEILLFASIEKRNDDTSKENHREAQKVEEISWLTMTVVCGKAVEFMKIEKNLPCPAPPCMGQTISAMSTYILQKSWRAGTDVSCSAHAHVRL